MACNDKKKKKKREKKKKEKLVSCPVNHTGSHQD